jgi:HrpA-like RNA helicase
MDECADVVSNSFERLFPLQVPGRLYPITIEYIPPEVKEGEKQQPLPSESRQTVSGLTTSKLPGAKPKPIDTTPYLRLLERIDREYERSQRGDLLVFLSGINEITAVAERMREHAKKTKKWIVLTLHSSVPAEEQVQPRMETCFHLQHVD